LKLQSIIVLTIIVFSCCKNATNKDSNTIAVESSKKTETELSSQREDEVFTNSQNAKQDSKSIPCQESLIKAAQQGKLSEFKNLTENGCDPNSEKTLLFHSIYNGNDAITELLLSTGANVNEDLGREMSPFHVAAGRSTTDIFKRLLENGGDVHTHNKMVFSTPTPLSYAIAKRNRENAKLLINLGADIEPEDIMMGSSALFMAVLARDYEMTKYILEYGANPNLSRTDGCVDCISQPVGITPLFLFLRPKQDFLKAAKFMELFEDYGAKFNVENDDGLNLIEYAAPHGNARMIKYLLSKDVEVGDGLALAASFQNNEVVELLP